MGVFESIILGLIQGLTEFIPVSSSGHLVIAQIFLSGASDHLFLEWIDLGTFLALVVYFRHKIIAIILDVAVRKRYRLARNILITSIPAGVVGLTFSSFIESSTFFGSISTVAVSLGAVGVLMVLVDKIPSRSAITSGEKLGWRRALFIGLSQVFALIPGVSRSGSTIIAGRVMGMSAADAAEYSFLVSLPIMFGLILKLVVSSEGRDYFIAHAPTLLLSNTIAFVSGLWAVSFLIKYLSRHGLSLFGWYRIALSAVLLSLILLQLV